MWSKEPAGWRAGWCAYTQLPMGDKSVSLGKIPSHTPTSQCECGIPHDAFKNPDRMLKNPVSSKEGEG